MPPDPPSKRRTSPRRLALATAIGVASMLASPALHALEAGATVPAVTVEDTSQHKVPIPTGRATLLFYEEKDAGVQNEHVRNLVGPFIEAPENKDALRFMAVADLERFNWVKLLALPHVRAAEKKESVTLYCDWTGAARKAWKLTRGKSGVILLDAAGAVRFIGEGHLSTPQTEALVAALRAMHLAEKPL